MEVVLYIFVVIFFLLAIGLIYTLVKDFKGIVRGIVNGCRPQLIHPITWILSPIWLIGIGVDFLFGSDIVDKSNSSKSNGPEKYSLQKKLPLDFLNGDKIIVSETSVGKAENLVKDFVEFCYGDLKFENFNIKSNQNIKIHCPNNISFYDFSILTQHFCNSVKKSWGIFKSGRLNYYSHSDENTLHNLVGQTADGQKFSIYTLDDLYNNQFLKLNQELKVKKFDWKEMNKV